MSFDAVIDLCLPANTSGRGGGRSLVGAYYGRTSNRLRAQRVVDRRTFIGGAGGLLVVPLVARAQQPAIPVIGFLNSRAAGDDPHLLAAFRQGLKEAGYVEGQNVAIEYRFAEGQDNRLPALAADLVRRHVAVIAANGLAAQAAKAATATIPIVFSAGYDPVEVGLVASMSRPGGNITGVTVLDVELGPKRLELLHALIPTATIIAVLVNPADPARAETITRNMQAAARNLRLQLLIDQRARAALGDEFATETVGPMVLKGFAQPVQVFALAT